MNIVEVEELMGLDGSGLDFIQINHCAVLNSAVAGSLVHRVVMLETVEDDRFLRFAYLEDQNETAYVGTEVVFKNITERFVVVGIGEDRIDFLAEPPGNHRAFFEGFKMSTKTG